MLVNRPRQVRNACYTRVEPTPVAAPRLLGWSDDLGRQLGIGRPAGAGDPLVEVLAGNRVLPGMQPYAARYGGHQFGHWAGQLGDGRAITLGELLAADGTRQELQLKGAGRTPYSRTADGRAVLRSSLREFLCSEAMHWLGVPTTRALSLVATGEPVVRDMFYDGHPREEPGAVVCRVAPSFVRFGNFQILAAQGEHDALRKLGGLCCGEFFPGSRATSRTSFTRSAAAPALLMADWMRLGFVHGVMNTDNMSDPRPDHRLRPLRLARGLRPGVDAQHHRRRGPALLLRQPAAHRAVEPRAPGRSAAAAGARQGAAGAGAGALREHLRATPGARRSRRSSASPRSTGRTTKRW